VLAVAGVYGVMSFSTSQRVREFGVRVALGATGGDIVRLVVGDGLKLAGSGVIVGTLIAWPLMGLLRGLVFGVTVTDPLTFLTVAVALVIVAVAACSLPAFRALKIRPVEALKGD
jgi:ABC-type antimicrobial peptide transport system permease subunit